MYMVEEPPSDDGEEESKLVINVEDVAEDLQLSLHAVWGKNGPQIMRIKGNCQKKVLKILIYIGSTYNLLGAHMVDKVKYDVSLIGPKTVEVANGQILQCNKWCANFGWEMQENAFTTEVYLIPLETYDLVFGRQWLSTLGEIKWDFGQLSMVFQIEGKKVKLRRTLVN